MSEEQLLSASVSAKTLTTSIKISAVTGNQLAVEYKCLPGNLPNSYSNYLVAWKAYDSIPWNDTSADAYAVISGNKSQGSQELDLIVEVGQEYVVGFAVGPKGDKDSLLWKNVCSTGSVPSDDSQETTYVNPELSDFQVLSNSVSMKFRLPEGATPKSNGAWIGIWQTGSASYTTPPMGAAAISLDSSRGGASINGLKIARDQTYTVALFTSGWKAGTGGTNVQTAMACTATINT